MKIIQMIHDVIILVNSVSYICQNLISFMRIYNLDLTFYSKNISIFSEVSVWDGTTFRRTYMQSTRDQKRQMSLYYERWPMLCRTEHHLSIWMTTQNTDCLVASCHLHLFYQRLKVHEPKYFDVYDGEFTVVRNANQ